MSSESVFSGVKRLLGDVAATMSPELLELYVFIHYNWQYECRTSGCGMRPSVEEIVKAYHQEYGFDARPEDNEPDDEAEEQEEGSAGED